jgi:hypothetical protein
MPRSPARCTVWDRIGQEVDGGAHEVHAEPKRVSRSDIALGERLRSSAKECGTALSRLALWGLGDGDSKKTE